MSWAVLVSECSHVFCCVLPTVFSILSVLVGLGLVGAVPVWMDALHHVMHDWEVPIILFSGLVVLAGWALHLYSQKLDCHDTGCVHGGCAPKKNRNLTILKIATVLFVVNVTIYMVFHRGLETFGVTEPAALHAHHDHTHNDHAHHGHDH